MAQRANNNGKNSREVAKERRRAQSNKGNAGTAKAQTGQTAMQTATGGGSNGSLGNGTSREASKARREAMSSAGKAAVKTQDRTRNENQNTAMQSAPATNERAGKEGGCGCGCKGKTEQEPNTVTKAKKYRNASKLANNTQSGRAVSKARRQAMSSRGKQAANGKNMSTAQSTRAMNPNISGRELAQMLREQRSQTGKTEKTNTTPCGPQRKNKTREGTIADANWKVGSGETSHGQRISGTMVGRSEQVTGDEASTCRTITGTEYLGADIFREFCDAEGSKSPRKVSVTSTSHGNSVSGNSMGRSEKVTGNEPGSCKHVTGNEYISSNESDAFCGRTIDTGPSKITRSQTQKGQSVTGNNVGRSSRVTGDETGSNRDLTGTQYMQKAEGGAPASIPGKVGNSATLRGSNISGTMVGRGKKVTGDEPGSCRNVTGDDYIGQEQYTGFCKTTPAPTDRKVGVSQTMTGKPVSGTLTGRSGRVTGDEPGTCKAITGTPYAGAEQYKSYCDDKSKALASARMRRPASTAGAPMTGLQPGIDSTMTGNDKGRCESVSGTPYVGADQMAQVCPSEPASPNSPDFPQMLDQAPWGQFSVSSPNHASQTTESHDAITGTQYEKGQITGPFGMASGKVTGTEEARFGGNRQLTPAAGMSMPTQDMVAGRTKSRITGEGMDAGPKISGDDWDRGDNVTGTEGLSATRRNPTRRGGNQSMAMEQIAEKRNEELAEPVSKVTGGSGNTEKGALITYSGGARG